VADATSGEVTMQLAEATHALHRAALALEGAGIGTGEPHGIACPFQDGGGRTPTSGPAAGAGQRQRADGIGRFGAQAAREMAAVLDTSVIRVLFDALVSMDAVLDRTDDQVVSVKLRQAIALVDRSITGTRSVMAELDGLDPWPSPRGIPDPE